MSTSSSAAQLPSRRSALMGGAFAAFGLFGIAACTLEPETPHAVPSTVGATEPIVPERRPLIAAHRGNSGVAPENTVAAFESAWRAGADLLEIDMQVSADGQAVVIHDDTVDRTTNGSGKVHSHSAAELQELDAGSWFSPGFAGAHVPAIDDVIEFLLVHEDMGLVAEMKDDWDLEPVQSVLAAFETAGITDRVTIQSFSANTLRYVRQASDSIAIAVLNAEVRTPQFELATELQASAMIARGWFLLGNFDVLEQIHNAGLIAMAWSTDDVDEWEALVVGGVDVIMTNYPDRLQGWFNGRYPNFSA